MSLCVKSDCAKKRDALYEVNAICPRVFVCSLMHSFPLYSRILQSTRFVPSGKPHLSAKKMVVCHKTNMNNSIFEAS